MFDSENISLSCENVPYTPRPKIQKPSSPFLAVKNSWTTSMCCVFSGISDTAIFKRIAPSSILESVILRGSVDLSVFKIRKCTVSANARLVKKQDNKIATCLSVFIAKCSNTKMLKTSTEKNRANVKISPKQ